MVVGGVVAFHRRGEAVVKSAAAVLQVYGRGAREVGCVPCAKIRDALFYILPLEPLGDCSGDQFNKGFGITDESGNPGISVGTRESLKFL